MIRHVLELWDTDCHPDHVIYAQPADDGQWVAGSQVQVARTDWNDLGQPSFVTVTIQPGHRLGGPGETHDGTRVALEPPTVRATASTQTIVATGTISGTAEAVRADEGEGREEGREA